MDAILTQIIPRILMSISNGAFQWPVAKYFYLLHFKEKAPIIRQLLGEGKRVGLLHDDEYTDALHPRIFFKHFDEKFYPNIISVNFAVIDSKTGRGHRIHVTRNHQWRRKKEWLIVDNHELMLIKMQHL